MENRRLMTRLRTGSRRRAFTLVEVLVALVLTLAGVLAIIQLFPVLLETNNEAALKGAAATLAQQKVEEMRRDRDFINTIMNQAIAGNAETTPVVWPDDPRLAYSYSGQPALEESPPPPPTLNPEMWIIIRLAPSYDPEQRVIFQSRFGQ